MSALPKPLPELIVAIALALAAGASAGEAAAVWPDAPREPAAPERDADQRYAAGLYTALEKDLVASPSARRDSLRVLRARLGAGRLDEALALGRRLRALPLDLALMLRFAAAEPWRDEESRRWRERLGGEDGESLYWRARLELALGRPDEARRRLETLRDQRAESIFAPAALELLAALPEGPPAASASPIAGAEGGARQESGAPASAHPGQAGAARATSAAPEGGAASEGLRLQWGVFRDPQRARRMAEAIRAYGEATEILAFARGGEELYRVCSAPYPGEAAARARGKALAERHGLEFVLYRGGTLP